MAHRRPGGSDPRNPEAGTPEYDWLYGESSGTGASGADDATRALRVTPASDGHTRRMPTVPPGPSGTSGTSGRSRRSRPPRNSGTPEPTAAGPPRRARRLPRPRLRWLTLLIVAWLLFLVAVPLWAWNKVDKVNAMPGGQRPGEQPGTTYLLVGSDSRADLTPAERKALGTGGDVGQRTDTIMVLHTGEGPNLLMSIPRDSLVEIPGYGTTKINAAYAYGGPRLLIQTIEASTGIRIDHYVEIGFGGVVGLVDAVGGIQICPETAMRDPLAKLNIKKGCQQADGKTALGYARSRHTSSLGDLKRAEHQREVVGAVGKAATSPMSFVNPWRYFRLADAATQSFRVSEGTSPFALAEFGFAMTRVTGKSGLTCGVPISDMAVHWDQDRSEQMFQLIIDDNTRSIPRSLCTPSGLPR